MEEKNQIQICQKCNKEFPLIPLELEFYEKNGIPLPIRCPECRQLHRLMLSRTRALYKQKCKKCGKEMLSVFSPETDYNVFCQQCYWESI